MDSNFLHNITRFLDTGYLLINRFGVLLFVLLFFSAVYCANTFFKRRMSMSKVTGTIKAALAGLVLLFFESQIKGVPAIGAVVQDIQSLIVLYCLANLSTYLVVDIYVYYKMDKEVPSFIRDLVTFVIYIVFAMASLRVVFNLELSSILTTTTVLTAAVAFAMQTTIANIISGFYVQNDPNLKLRTWLSLKDQGIVGEIVNVGFRYTTLKALDNTKIMVPNHHIMQNVVVNLGYGEDKERTRISLKVGLGYDLPPEKAKEILLRVLQDDKDVLNDPAPFVRVSSFGDSSVDYELLYYLENYRTHLNTRGNLLARIWYAVTREGYSIPFPHREVIAKTPQEPFPLDAHLLQGAFRRTEILGSLGGEEIRKLSEKVRLKVFAAGEMVVRQNEEGDSLFLVMRGVLDVLIDGSRVGTLSEGSIFGEMSLLTGERRKATVVASTEVHLVEISKEDIGPMIQSNPDLLDKLSAILAHREEMNIAHRKKMELSKSEIGMKETFKQKLKAFFNL
jgi:small-conductance mechanosensitive channel/CRP-like cAMP-binding protein